MKHFHEHPHHHAHHHDSFDQDQFEEFGRGRGDRGGWGGRPGRGPGGPGGRSRGMGPGRAGRGQVGQSILVLLAEQPMHGYELITALEERSGGRWRPSPGAIYPALAKLEEKGLVSSEEDDGKRRYSLTDAGRQRVTEAADAGITEPWDQPGWGRRGELHRALGELVGPVRQIGRFGSPAQVTAAATALQEATAKLYAILASPPAPSSPDEPEPAE